MAKRVIRYFSVFLATVLLCMLLLCAAAFAPQDSIDENVKESAKIMVEEGVYPYLLDKTYGSRLDNWTDALILMETKAMTSEKLETVLTNPRYVYDGKNPVESLYDYVHDEDPVPHMHYTRYWMGFRAILRWVMTFLNYYQIRRYLAFVFFALFAAVICSLFRSLGSQAAMTFALSILLIRPYVVCSSLQFSCCFLIAFIAMLMVPWIHRHPKLEGLFFMELGMLTMFFDFYTTPIITFGLPMVYLYMLRTDGGASNSVGLILKNAGIWLLSYGAMWITKLVLTEVLTAEDAYQMAMLSVFIWFGKEGYATEDGAYNPMDTFRALMKSITSDEEGAAIMMAALAVLAVLLIAGILCRKISIRPLGKNWGLLVIAVLPVIWFAVTAEPARVHFWFQHRSVALLYWALGGYFSMALRNRKKSTA